MAALVRAHSSSKITIEEALEAVREGRSHKHTATQIMSVLKRKGFVKDGKNGRVGAIWAADISIMARQAGCEMQSFNPRPSRSKKPKNKTFDAFKMIQDIITSNLEEDTKRFLTGLLSKQVEAKVEI